MITLVADHPVHARIVRAYISRGRPAAYAIRDAFGWAVVAQYPGQPAMTVDRFDPWRPTEPEAEVRTAAINGLARYVAEHLTELRRQ